MPNIFVYDTECSGVRPRHDRPFQFAAQVCDQHGTPIRTINLRGRLPRHVLPDPQALLVTGQSYSQIQGSPMSHYRFIARVHAELRAAAPSIMLSYNGLRYDEEILRHSFYANLLTPYVTQLGGNQRVDLFVVARALASLAPDALTLPTGTDGRPSFKLDALAAANGITDHEAHDALGDAEATMQLARLLKTRAPDAFAACCQTRHKDHVLTLLHSGEPLVHVGWSHERGAAVIQIIQPVTTDATNPREWLCVDLAQAHSLLQMTTPQLRQAMTPRAGRSDIIRVRANAMPMVFSLKRATALGVRIRKFGDVGARVKNAPMFGTRLKAAATACKQSYGEPATVWDQLYAGGFYPSVMDRNVFDRFHEVSPAEKWEMIPDLTDPRAQHMARWLIGSEWPDTLSHQDCAAIEEAFRAHLMQDKAPWTTIPSALARIAELLPAASQRDRTILHEYEMYLVTLRDSAQPALVAGP